jgi:cytidyltransferase-like protein
MKNKIVPLEALADIRGILLHGSFDCLHVGHLRYFSWGKKLHPCQRLIVTLTSDEFFPKYKGENRPAFPEDIRAECISYIDIVDYVSIVRESTGVMAINTIKPYVYGKGWEAKGIIPEETAATEQWGGRVEFMEKESEGGQIYSSGRILSGEYLSSRSAK